MCVCKCVRARVCVRESVHACVNYVVFYSLFCSYLILEYVSGGELFDYLVKRVRLPEKEVRWRKYVRTYKCR